MVESNVPGVWEKEDDRYKKENTNVHIILEKEDEGVYCILQYNGGGVREYRKETEYVNELIKNTMDRESHGENIRDILSDENFEVINP